METLRSRARLATSVVVALVLVATLAVRPVAAAPHPNPNPLPVTFYSQLDPLWGSVLVGANPQRITDPRYSEITANVFDENGNPVRNVPVIFTLSASGAGLQESLDSGSQPVFTDSNGQARDVLRTRQNRADPPKIVTVTATTPNTRFGDVQVTIN